MLVVGLTGGIGSGKSTVADLFSRLGVPIIDTDILARKAVEPDQPALREIADYFGPSVVSDHNILNRKKLAEICFDDEASRKKLEEILHPRIRDLMQKEIDALHTAYAIVVIPLLVETGQNKNVDRVLVINSSTAQQVERVLNRDDRDKDQIESIIRAQASSEQRLALADDIIDNRNTPAELNKQVEDLHKKYLKLSRNYP